MNGSDAANSIQPLWANPAIIGAFTASLTSALAIMINGMFERRTRQRETRLDREARGREAEMEHSQKRKDVLIDHAVKLAESRNQLLMKAFDKSKSEVELRDPLVMAETYYRWLTHLWEHGKLPDDPDIQR
jgi:hypothetical protein